MGTPQRVFADLNPGPHGEFGTLIENFPEPPQVGEKFVVFADDGTELPALTTEVDGHTVTIEDAGSFNYTHNCNRMIRHAGFEEWPYQLDGMAARDFCKRLDDVLVVFRKDHDLFRAMNPENGWGDFDRLHLLLADILDRFDPYPSARVGCSA